VTRLQLTNSVLEWLHRVSFRPQAAGFDAVSSFISLAEEDLNHDLRARCMITRVSQPVIGQYTPLPCDYIEAYDVRLENGPALEYQPRAQLADMRWARVVQAPGDPAWAGFAPPQVPWNNGQPTFFSVVGAEMELSPFPDDFAQSGQTLPNLELAYYQRQELGSNDTDTTPVLTQLPSIYLYGTLIQSAPFVRDDQRIQTWAGLYQAAISKANRESERARWQGTRLRQQYRRLA
jgi:hypothetical protein